MKKTESMFQVVEEWQRSGIGKQKYAEKIGMCYSTLQYWCKRYREHHNIASLPLAPAFVPVTVSEDRVHEYHPSVMVITLASGTRIEIR